MDLVYALGPFPMKDRDMPEFARPPRGWLKGVLVTMLVFWYSGITWQAFLTGERPVKTAGMAITIVAAAIIAHQALTNDDYKTSRATRVGNLLLLLGVIVFIVGDRI